MTSSADGTGDTIVCATTPPHNMIIAECMSHSFHLVFINFHAANGLIQLRSNTVLRITDQLTVDVFKNTLMNIWRIEWGDTPLY